MKNNSIALGGLFACLHVLLLFVGKLVVGSELLMALILPLLSTIYTLKSDGKSVVMFSVATILVCCLFDFISTFIYVVPSLICGVVYGALRKRMFKELELLCITGLVHVFTIAFSFFVIVLFFKEVDFLDVFEAIFSLKGENLYVASLLFLFVLGFSEAFVIHFISDNELERFANRVEKNEFVPKWFLVGSIVSLVALRFTYFLAVKAQLAVCWIRCLAT